MPSRKKTSKKQSSDQLTKEFVVCCTDHLGVNEDFENVKEWVRREDYNTKRFAKLLPITTKGLPEGELDYEMVAYALEATYIWFTSGERTSRLRHLSCVLADVITPSSSPLLHRANTSVMAGRLICHPDGATTDIQSFLTDSIKEVRSFYTAERRIAIATQRMGETFVRDSPVYSLTEADFLKAVIGKVGDVDTEELWRECEEARRHIKEFFRITSNFHPTFHKCWECSKLFANILHCGGCKAAAYCSRNCQAAAWKGGHKAKCNRVKNMNTLHLTCVEELEKAHVTGMLDGFKLYRMSDIMVTSHCMRCAGAQIDSEPSKQSMKNYYANLGRIIRGEWWVYDLSGKIESTYEAAGDKFITAVFILGLLAEDWFGKARLTIGTDDPQKVTAWADPVFRQICGPPISVEELLEFYKSVDPEQSRSPVFSISSYNYLRTVYDKLDDNSGRWLTSDQQLLFRL